MPVGRRNSIQVQIQQFERYAQLSRRGKERLDIYGWDET